MHPKITVAAATTLIFLRLLTQEKFHSITRAGVTSLKHPDAAEAVA